MCKTIKQKVKLKASPDVVYKILTDSKSLEAVTGQKANISNRIGGNFSVLSGSITGINVDLFPSKRIVLGWRRNDFPDGIFSMVTFVLTPLIKGETEIILTHRGVPKNSIPSVEKLWKEDYWQKIKNYLPQI